MATKISYGFAVKSLFRYLDVPYIWGGQSEKGLDCSGLVGEWWKDLAFVPESFDTTADALMDSFQSGARKGTKLVDGIFGALVFYGTGSHASHVTIAINHEWCIGANGGNSTMNTEAKARAKGAEVRFDRIDYHYKSILGIWMPDYVFVDSLATPQTPVTRTVLKNVNLRSQPTTSAPSLGVLTKGSTVSDVSSATITADGRIWRNVQVQNLGPGWVASDFVS